MAAGGVYVILRMKKFLWYSLSISYIFLFNHKKGEAQEDDKCFSSAFRNRIQLLSPS